MKFRKKPIVIEAVTVDSALDAAAYNWANLPVWLRDYYNSKERGKGIIFERDAVSIVTLEGVMRGERGDWIIRGIQGELYPCKNDIFEATYEAVAEPREEPQP